MGGRAKTKRRRHDKHTVSLLIDLMVFVPKYRGKILTDEVAMVAKGITCKTCIFSSGILEVFFELYRKENFIIIHSKKFYIF